MAGMQYPYWFFPTDFYYPRPPTTTVEPARKAALPVETPKKIDAADVSPTSVAQSLHKSKPNRIAVRRQEQSQGRMVMRARNEKLCPIYWLVNSIREDQSYDSSSLIGVWFLGF